MRISRIASPDAPYDASVAAQTCDDGETSLGCPAVLYEVAGENVADTVGDLPNSTAKLNSPQIKVLGGFFAENRKCVNKVNPLKPNKKEGKSVAHFKVRIYFI